MEAKKLKSFNSILNSLPGILKYVLIAAVITFISWLYPDKARFSYEYKNGSTWNYDDLYAPFDFPLIKTEDELKAARQKLIEGHTPYYRKDPRISEEHIQSFIEELNILGDSLWRTPRLQSIKMELERVGISFLKNAYDQGIIKVDSLHRSKDPSFLIQLIEHNNTKPHIISNIKNVDEVRNTWIRRIKAIPQIPDSLGRLLLPFVQANIQLDRALTESSLEEQLSKLSKTEGLFKKGDMIVSKGYLITDEVYKKINSYKYQYETQIIGSKSPWGILGGYSLLTLILVGLLLFYLYSYHREVFDSFSGILFLLMWLALYAYAVSAVEKIPNISTFIVPFAIAPLVIKNFFNHSIALFVLLIMALITSFISTLGYEFTFLTILSGVVAILGDSETRSWNQFFKTILLVLGAYLLGNLGLELIKQGNLNEMNFSTNIWFIANAFLTLLAYPMIPLLERIFGYTSSITLAELADFNKPLLKDLSLRAKGTFQHSLQVSNLAAAAADRIGANSLLIKTAALYHDIGKLAEPQYFIENQHGQNPHDTLNNPFESARKIIDHVILGEKMAKKHRIPTVIIDFINTHHGDSRVEYFYRKQLERKPDGEFDESLFRYPGPKPRTKEQTILMLADTIEAASKSLKQPDEKSIKDLIDKLITQKIQDGQLKDSPLSYKELEMCRASFNTTLQSIYHVRIAYPDAKTNQIS